MSVRRITTFAALVAVLAGATLVAREQMTLKLATQAPVLSSWHKALMDMGAEWNTKTAGRVKLTVYAGGTQGSEEATIRMMRPGVDQLQANLLTASGMANIDEAFNVFGMPFLFQDDAEATHVRDKLTPLLDQRLAAKGFRKLAWGSAGWVQLFSKNQIRTVAELKNAKLFTSQGDDKMVQWYKNNGFKPVALSPADIPAQLKLSTGMIDAAPNPPYAALVFQIFRDAKYMLDIRVAPLVGALVVTTEAWNKVEAADQAVLTATTKALEQKLLAEAPKQDADSVATMKTRGLTVTTLDAAGLASFRAEAEKMTASMRGTLVPADIFDMAVRERDAFRKTRK
jgi:TRAP-type transport system periplasmic protein